MKILFLTASDPATNPRTVKEMQFALKEGHEVHLVYVQSTGWSRPLSDYLINNALVGAVMHPVEPNEFWVRFKIGHLLSKIGRLLSFLPYPDSLMARSICHSERAFYLQKKTASLESDFDLVVGHTLAAFVPAIRFAKKCKAKVGLDVEDYHPGEAIPPSFQFRNEIEQRRKIMTAVLPMADYVSVASEPMRQLIGDEFLAQNHTSLITIENSFWQNEFSHHNGPQEGPLKLVWFSQNIAHGRGLEVFISACDELPPQEFTLTLIGALNPTFGQEYTANRSYIEILPPQTQLDLHQLIANFDIGLALEDGSRDQNKNICLSNKIWAYGQAGLFVLASNTIGQSSYINQHKGSGSLCSLTTEDIKTAIKELIHKKAEIRNQRGTRFEQFTGFSFDEESKKLKELWNQTN